MNRQKDLLRSGIFLTGTLRRIRSRAICSPRAYTSPNRLALEGLALEGLALAGLALAGLALAGLALAGLALAGLALAGLHSLAFLAGLPSLAGLHSLAFLAGFPLALGRFAHERFALESFTPSHIGRGNVSSVRLAGFTLAPAIQSSVGAFIDCSAQTITDPPLGLVLDVPLSPAAPATFGALFGDRRFSPSAIFLL